MIHKTLSPKSDHVRVVFELPSSVWANRVYLCGDFNEWNQADLPMHQERDGAWRAEIDLPLGQTYEFHYIVDGQPQTDYHADGFAATTCGMQKSIVRTDAPVHRMPPLRSKETELLLQKAVMLREKFANRHSGRSYLPKAREMA